MSFVDSSHMSSSIHLLPNYVTSSSLQNYFLLFLDLVCLSQLHDLGQEFCGLDEFEHIQEATSNLIEEIEKFMTEAKETNNVAKCRRLYFSCLLLLLICGLEQGVSSYQILGKKLGRASFKLK